MTYNYCSCKLAWCNSKSTRTLRLSDSRVYCHDILYVPDEAILKRRIEEIEYRGPDETQVCRSANVPATMAHC